MLWCSNFDESMFLSSNLLGVVFENTGYTFTRVPLPSQRASPIWVAIWWVHIPLPSGEKKTPSEQLPFLQTAGNTTCVTSKHYSPSVLIICTRIPDNGYNGHLKQKQNQNAGKNKKNKETKNTPDINKQNKKTQTTNKNKEPYTTKHTHTTNSKKQETNTGTPNRNRNKAQEKKNKETKNNKQNKKTQTNTGTTQQ